LRSILGLKSRLSIYALPDMAKQALDTYFSEVFPKTKERALSEVRPDYEKMYDVPMRAISQEEAKRIEQSSWQTTKQLIEAFDSSNENQPSAPIPVAEAMDDLVFSLAQSEQPISAVENEHPMVDCSANASCFFAEWIDFVRSAFDGDVDGQRKYCLAHGCMPETVADAVNEVALDTIGDIILEAAPDGSFIVISDYRQEITAMLDQCS
jgi:hypothetical protein